MIYLDRETSVITNKLSIYRKACHSGWNVHILSNVPHSVKLSTVRNMFLRAYRYCDSLFLAAEERKIYEDFDRLGYDRKLVDKARLSARKGRDREIRIRDGLEQPRPPRERSRFQLWIPYHRKAYGLRYRFGQKGVDVSFSNRDTIVSRVAGKKRSPTDCKGGVYMLTCDNNTCEQVYVGHSKDIPKRLGDHEAAARLEKSGYSSAQHSKRPNHRMITDQELAPYKSNSITHRLIVETCLISVCNTVKGNTASAAKEIAPVAHMIIQGIPLDWELISLAQPNLDRKAIPKKHRSLFSQPSTSRPPRPPEVTENIPEVLVGTSTSPQRRVTRSRGTSEDLHCFLEW